MASILGFAVALAAQFTVAPAPEWDALFDRTSGWTGADGIYSIPLDGVDAWGGIGRADTLFVFSDTFVGEVLADGTRQNARLVNNTVGLLPRNGFPGGMNYYYGGTYAQPTAVFLPSTPNAQPGEWYWPHDGIALPDATWLFAQRFESTGAGGAFGFRRVGLALLELPPGSQPPFANAIQRDCPFHLPATGAREEMVFGVGILANTAEAGAPFPDGFLYVYGIREDPWVKKLLCARVAPADLANFAQWRFWDGAGWNADPERSAVLTGRVSSELSVTPLADGRYALVYQADTLSRYVAAKIGQSPVGPFSSQIQIYECPLPSTPEVWSYNAKAHPHLSAHPRELLISYNVNAVDFWDHFRYAAIYRPRFLRVSW